MHNNQEQKAIINISVFRKENGTIQASVSAIDANSGNEVSLTTSIGSNSEIENNYQHFLVSQEIQKAVLHVLRNYDGYISLC